MRRLGENLEACSESRIRNAAKLKLGSGRRGNNELDGRLAWVYVGLRVAHSLVHVSSNKLMVRFTLFIASSLVLLGLTARATMLLF